MRSVNRKVVGVGVFVTVLAVFFCMGRYGWKLFGFGACQSAGIEQVTVEAGQVHISGFYPGSFPSGFCGCYTKEKDGILYVGFRFSPLFGFFENGKIDVSIPTKGEISKVVLKTSTDEYVLAERAGDGTYFRPKRDLEQSGGVLIMEEEDEL